MGGFSLSLPSFSHLRFSPAVKAAAGRPAPQTGDRPAVGWPTSGDISANLMHWHHQHSSHIRHHLESLWSMLEDINDFIAQLKYRSFPESHHFHQNNELCHVPFRTLGEKREKEGNPFFPGVACQQPSSQDVKHQGMKERSVSFSLNLP